MDYIIENGIKFGHYKNIIIYAVNSTKNLNKNTIMNKMYLNA